MVDAGKIAEIITGIMKESIEDIGNVVAADGKAIHEKTNEPPVFQKMLYGDIKLYMEENTNGKEMEVYTAVNKNNGRTEKRICRKTENTGWIYNKNEWEGLRSNFVQRWVKHRTNA